MKGSSLALFVIAAAGLILTPALAGCEKAMRDMYDQPKYKPLAASPLWPDQRASRPVVAGAVPVTEGTFAGTSSGRLGAIQPAPDIRPAPLDDRGRPLGGALEQRVFNPLSLDRATFERGRERFEIFCAPCHSPVGDGDGLIARRGFPHPPSYHIERLRNAPDAHFYAVITHGYGTMHAYGDRVAPADRWAIVAYIRALQLARNARIEDVPVAARASLEGEQ